MTKLEEYLRESLELKLQTNRKASIADKQKMIYKHRNEHNMSGDYDEIYYEYLDLIKEKQI